MIQEHGIIFFLLASFTVEFDVSKSNWIGRLEVGNGANM